jgi:hypothetical protein
MGRSLRHLVDTITGLGGRGVGFRSSRQIGRRCHEDILLSGS